MKFLLAPFAVALVTFGIVASSLSKPVEAQAQSGRWQCTFWMKSSNDPVEIGACKPGLRETIFAGCQAHAKARGYTDAPTIDPC